MSGLVDGLLATALFVLAFMVTAVMKPEILRAERDGRGDVAALIGPTAIAIVVLLLVASARLLRHAVGLQ